MIDELNRAIETYHQKWHTLIDKRANKDFFCNLKPTAVAWKTTDRAEYDKLFAELHDLCDVIVDVEMDDRWIAKMHLKNTELTGGIEVIKLMQRRPGSTDAVGLDHVDWLWDGPSVDDLDAILEKEPNLKWNHETNGAHWVSLWFAGTEAKLRTDTVVDSCMRELKAINKRLIGGD